MFRGNQSHESDRQRMVAEQLRRRGIRSERVLAAMGRVPRELFVPTGMRPSAYEDRALPISCEQTISQPYIVALMTEALEIGVGDKVLEVGTGSGYQAAVLAELAGEVVTIERHEALSLEAQIRLQELAYTNIRFYVGDGSLGCPAEAPFDCIIITAASSGCPPALWEQLAVGGRLIGPFGDSLEQVLYLLTKTETGAEETNLGGCRFVPLIREHRED